MQQATPVHKLQETVKDNPRPLLHCSLCEIWTLLREIHKIKLRHPFTEGASRTDPELSENGNIIHHGNIGKIRCTFKRDFECVTATQSGRER